MVLRIQYVSLFPPELEPQLEVAYPSVMLDVLLLEIKKKLLKRITQTKPKVLKTELEILCPFTK